MTLFRSWNRMERFHWVVDKQQPVYKRTSKGIVTRLLRAYECVTWTLYLIFPTALNVSNLDLREPIIYHGFTLTTKLPFREVIHTIKVISCRCVLQTICYFCIPFFRNMLSLPQFTLWSSPLRITAIRATRREWQRSLELSLTTCFPKRIS